MEILVVLLIFALIFLCVILILVDNRLEQLQGHSEKLEIENAQLRARLNQQLGELEL